MFVNMAIIIPMILYVVYVYIKGELVLELSKILSFVFSVITALIFNVQVASYISNNVEFLQIDPNLQILLSIEILYYRTIAFIIMFGLVFLVVYTILKSMGKNIKFCIKLNKFRRSHIIRSLLAVINAFLFMYIIILGYMATPYSLDYSSSLLNNYYKMPILSNVIGSVTFPYSKVDVILNNNDGLSNDEASVKSLQFMEEEGYLTIEEMKFILNNDENYGSLVKEYLEIE